MSTTAIQAQTDLPIKVEEFTSIIQTAPVILRKNQQSVMNCENAGKALLDTIEGNGGIDNDELDQKVADYIAKAKITVKNMNSRRSPLTQLLTKVAKEFTTLENAIDHTKKDTTPAILQTFRDKYAALKIEEQRKREEEERRRQALEAEKIEYRTELTLSMQKYYTQYFEEKAVEIENIFAGLNLDNFDEQSKKIVDFSVDYKATEHFKNYKDTFRHVYMQKADIDSIKLQVVMPLLNDCKKHFREDIQSIKDDLTIRLPSKRKELERIEELRRQDVEAAKRAEEAARKREEEEQKKREEEQKKREEEEKLRLEAQAAQADILSSFAQTAATAPTVVPDAKVTKKIKVNNPKGFLEIYQMWFIGEGAKLSIDELEKIHKKMITFCEKKANKDDEFIQSAFVEYVDEVKAK